MSSAQMEIYDESLKAFVPVKKGEGLPVSSAASRTLTTATIASGQTTSGTIDLSMTVLLGIQLPAAWTTASLTVQVSPDGSAWSPLYDNLGVQQGSWASSVAVASAAFSVSPAAFIGWKYARLVSGASQAASRSINIISRPIA